MIHEYIWGTEDWIYSDDEILVKRIDAKDKLSVQVHPDDEYAKRKGLANGKTECWYVTEREEGAFLYCGFEEDAKLSKELIVKAAEDGTIEKYLKKIFVEPGDFIFIPAGTVHAIGAGIKLIEVQQNSNTTYRLYDYKRVGADGKERELHLKEASECIKEGTDCGLKKLPCDCSFFKIEKKENQLLVRTKSKLTKIDIE